MIFAIVLGSSDEPRRGRLHLFHARQRLRCIVFVYMWLECAGSESVSPSLYCPLKRKFVLRWGSEKAHNDNINSEDKTF